MSNSKRSPSNTPTEVLSSPLGLLREAGARGSARDAVLTHEVNGQQQFVKSDTLPARMSEDDRRALEQAGVVFGEPVPGDDLFVYVTLPEGWSKSGTSHSMGSVLLDDKGRKRASIFYKAAFYDRIAHLSTNPRFGARTDYDYQNANSAVKVDVTDNDQVVFSSQPHGYTEKYSQGHDAAIAMANGEARAWLDEHYPDWKNVSAYWD